MNRLYSLPKDILSIIFNIVHNQKIKELAPSCKYIRAYFMYLRFKEIDFTESCFRHPTMLKFL